MKNTRFFSFISAYGVKKHLKKRKTRAKNPILAATCLFAAACSLVQYQPLEPIRSIDRNSGYRLSQQIARTGDDDIVFILMFSGGGSRAAAFGYGVLEALGKQPVKHQGQERPLLDSVDLVYGVSGGSILAVYYALHGKDTIPQFETRFLKQDFQRQLGRQIFSLANMPRLASPEFGRGDLLQEQLESALFGRATFADLIQRRKGPFAVISATDMTLGARIDFTQEYFDILCLDLGKLRLARAVAASSAVPIVFSPLTLNNHGGQCRYTLPAPLQQAIAHEQDTLQSQTRRELTTRLQQYENSAERPYIHLLDGGLTDNLGLRSLLDVAEIYPENLLQTQMRRQNVRKIVILSVNAQNRLASDIDKSAAIPGLMDQINAIINIPIDQYSQESLRRMRAFADHWNANERTLDMYFISLSLFDLPERTERDYLLNIPTTFFLPAEDVNRLKSAAITLLAQSGEYQRLLRDLAAQPARAPLFILHSEPQAENAN